MAVARQKLDCILPQVITVSQPDSMASPRRNSSLRTWWEQGIPDKCNVKETVRDFMYSATHNLLYCVNVMEGNSGIGQDHKGQKKKLLYARWKLRFSRNPIPSQLPTLFPLRAAPVRSSLLIQTWNPLGTRGRFHVWTGVGLWAIYTHAYRERLLIKASWHCSKWVHTRALESWLHAWAQHRSSCELTGMKYFDDLHSHAAQSGGLYLHSCLENASPAAIVRGFRGSPKRMPL